MITTTFSSPSLLFRRHLCSVKYTGKARHVLALAIISSILGLPLSQGCESCKCQPLLGSFWSLPAVSGRPLHWWRAVCFPEGAHTKCNWVVGANSFLFFSNNSPPPQGLHPELSPAQACPHALHRDSLCGSGLELHKSAEISKSDGAKQSLGQTPPTVIQPLQKINYLSSTLRCMFCW